MADDESRYEVIFAVDFSISAEPRRASRWSWVKLDADDLVTVRSPAFPTMRDAIDSANAYRRHHGGGVIRINIAESRHTDAAGVIHLR